MTRFDYRSLGRTRVRDRWGRERERSLLEIGVMQRMVTERGKRSVGDGGDERLLVRRAASCSAAYSSGIEPASRRTPCTLSHPTCCHSDDPANKQWATDY